MNTPPRERDWVPPLEFAMEQATELVEEPADGDAALPVPVAAAPVAGRRRYGRWLALGVACVVAVGLGFDTADLISRAFAASAALGTLVAASLVLAGGATLGLLAGEVSALRRLRRIETLRQEADRLLAAPRLSDGDRFAGALNALYADRPDLSPSLDRLRDLVTDAHDDGDVVRLIDREVLGPIDRRAYQLVVRAARDTAIATALSPAAVLDVAVVLWRNLKLVRDIASLYGARPGYAGSLRLLRRMLGNLAVAGVTESAHHVAVDALGGSLAAAVSTRIGQGVINGLLSARIGIAAMSTCRPVAFSADTRPNLGRVRAELLRLPKDVL